MDTLEFLKAVWPASGNFCLATPFKETYRHVVVKSIDDAARFAKRNRDDNIFFAVHTLKQPYIEDTEGRLNFRGDGPKRYYRQHENMCEARAFFFDLDVGESKPGAPPKYATRQEALDGLERFLFCTRLPRPLVSSSGGGFHVYWLITEPIPSAEWRRYAAALHAVARREGLQADPARTTDQASVLRVVGTTNIKPGRDPRPCVVVQAGTETPTEIFTAQLMELLGSDVIPDGTTRNHGARSRRGQGNLQRVWDGPVPSLDEVADVCAHVRTYRDVGGHTEGNEPIWYHLGCGIIPYVQDGPELFQELSSRHHAYDPDTADAKLEQYKDRTGDSPTTCAKLDQVCGGDACARCPFSQLGVNPLTIAVKHRQETPPAGIVVAEDATPTVEPGYPYTRTAKGIVMTVVKPAKGETPETAEEVLITPHDMFPVDDCQRTDLEQSFIVWALKIPNVKQQLVKVQSAVLMDLKALTLRLGDYGVYLSATQMGKVQNMMLHYASTLQKHKAANKQFDHLGWTDTTKTEFILPTELLNIDGTSKPCRMSASAQQTIGYVSKAGTLGESVRLMNFYNEPQYIKHQFVAMCGLGSVLFHANAELFGVVVNASGGTGGSKSTALYTAASFWGRPSSYVMNGTNTGMTALARMHRVHTLCQLPACMDELTEIDPRDAKNFVMGATQEDDRQRLNPDGTPKPKRSGNKSLITLCSANSSLHDLLGIDSRAGTAGNMRVFEIYFETLKLPPEAANEYLRGINQNYGWIGPEFMRRYIARREEIDTMVCAKRAELDRRFNLVGPERYWSAVMACAIVAGQLALDWGLLPFAIEPVRTWLYGEQLTTMRGIVQDEETEASPASLIGAFLNDRAGATVVVSGTHVEGNLNDQALRELHGAIDCHHDLLKKVIYIRKDAFRRWCTSRNKNPLRTLADLERFGLVSGLDDRRILGEGTKYASARAVCFTYHLNKGAPQ